MFQRFPKLLSYFLLLILGGLLLAPVITYATLTLDSTSLTSDTALTLKSASSSITVIGETNQTGAITVASSSETLTLNLGTGSGATTVNIATGATNAKTINIGTGNQTINTITIGNASSSVAVSGTLRITEGNQGANKFLGSDASGNATWQAIAGADGWTDSGETWTYASADDPTFTFTISGDKTSKYSPGMRIKLTQTTVKYFIVTAVSYSAPNTTITVYGGTDYDLANAAISANFYSGIKAPVGFPLNPAKWTVEIVDSSTRTQSTPTLNVWYNLGPNMIAIPIGVWDVYYNVALGANDNSGAIIIYVTLSTTNNSESDTDFSTNVQTNLSGVTDNTTIIPVGKRNTLALTVKTTYYLNSLINQSGTVSLSNYGALSKTVIRAVSAYL